MGVDNNNNNNEDLIIMKEDEFEVEEGDDVPLPGFRFHPTDEELVSFYLRRKLDKKPISIELIKQIDIYKYDPWDLPRASGTGGEKEGYFFCKRGRKYRNSIRPNRVTGSGFWKATGIDKPVYSNGGEGNDCIGLKKTLVYYRGSAGKGTKTDWMMHEFRLPSNNNTNHDTTNTKNHNHADLALQEAEIWTLCRIFKRNVSPRKHTPPEMMKSQLVASSTKRTPHSNTRIISTVDYCNNNNNTHQESYINFGSTLLSHNHHHHHQNEDQKPLIINNYNNNTCTSDNNNHQRNHHHHHQFHHQVMGQFNNNPLLVAQQHQIQTMTTPLLSSNNNNNNFWINNANASAATNYSDLFTFENWDELGSVVKFVVDSPSL